MNYCLPEIKNQFIYTWGGVFLTLPIENSATWCANTIVTVSVPLWRRNFAV